MLFRIDHETKLVYSQPVSESVIEIRMAPPSNEDQTLLGYHFRTTPAAPATSYRDGFGNRVDLFSVSAPCRELVMRATSFIRTHRRSGPERLAGVAWPADQLASCDVIEYLQPSPQVEPGPALNDFVRGLPPADGSLADMVGKLLAEVHGRLKYETKVTTAHTSVGEVLTLGRGVCQDFAHLFLGACRAIGLPARYVSGYVHQPGEVATHAWCQVWAGQAIGWIDVDPTRNEFVEHDHIVTAVGRDYADVPPNRGVWKGQAEETMTVAVKVQAIDMMPPDWTEWRQPYESAGGFAQVQVQRSNRSWNAQQQKTLRQQIRHQQSQQQQGWCRPPLSR